MKISSILDGDVSPRMNRKDIFILLVITVIFLAFTLCNLGSLSFPVTSYEIVPGEEILIQFTEKIPVQSVWINANICNGTMGFQTESEELFSHEQSFNGMFSWQSITLGTVTDQIKLTTKEGTIVINELAFFDNEGNHLSATITSANGKELLDEQQTVPETPSYLTGMYFDEIYHARTAYEILHGMSIYEWTHPPLGKLIISLGVLIFGMTPFGWRFMPAVFGAFMLPILYLLAKRLFRRTDYAFISTVLFAVDTMHFSQTRIATVDVFVVFFILLMALFMVYFIQQDFLHALWRKILVPLGLCGISFGLGVACKWTALYAGLGIAILFFSHIAQSGISAAKNGNTKTFWVRTVKTCLFCCVVFILIPGCIYFVSYTPFYLLEKSKLYGATNLTFSDCWRTLCSQQESMFAYHSNLTATHSCQSAWFEWPFTVRSVWFYVKSVGSKISCISSGGNPCVCWISATATLLLGIEALFGGFKKSAIEKNKSAIILIILILANYLPWVGVTRCTFQYHYFPTLPFVILCGVLLIQHEEAKGLSNKWKWIWLGAAFIYFLLLLPSASGIPTSRTYARFIEYVLPTGDIFHGYV